MALDSSVLGRLRRQVAQRILQARSRQLHCLQSAGQLPGDDHIAVHGLRGLVQSRSGRRAYFREFLRTRLQVERRRGQFLANHVVEVFADAPLLPFADFEKLAFELLALGHGPLKLVVHGEQFPGALHDTLFHLVPSVAAAHPRRAAGPSHPALLWRSPASVSPSAWLSRIKTPSAQKRDPSLRK